MPYYVYAIHTDSKTNRQYGVFEDFKEAEKCEASMRNGKRSHDNYIVEMFSVETGTKEEILDEINRIRAERNIQ